MNNSGNWISTRLIVLIMLLLSGCSSGYNTRVADAEKSFYGGDYTGGAKLMVPLVNSESNEKLLYMMEAGIMLHTAGEYQKSNEFLLEAARFAEDQKISVRKQAASVLLNEEKTRYHGEEFERVLIHMYAGINFLMQQNYQSARVEFNRVSRRLDELRRNNEEVYQQNIMARYLTALCYEIIAEIDNDEGALEFAYIEYKRILEMRPDYTQVQKDLLRLAHMMRDKEDQRKWGSRFKNVKMPEYKKKGELVVIHQSGRGAFKKSRGTLLADATMKGAIIISINNMSLKQGVTIGAVMVALNSIEHPIPDYMSAPNKTDHIAIVSADGSKLGRTYVLEDIEKTARLSAEKRYEDTREKVAAGVAVKAVATIASSIAAEKIAEQTPLKDASKLIGFLAGAGIGTALASQIKPDLRCWRSLPSNLQVSRIFLDPGKYTFYLQQVDNNGKNFAAEKVQVEIKENEKTIINRRTLQ
jgi:hypothetical protein